MLAEALAHLVLRLGGALLVDQASVLDGLSLDAFAVEQDGLAAAEVDVGRGQVMAATGIAGGVRLLGGFPADAVRLQVFEASSASLAAATKLASEPTALPWDRTGLTTGQSRVRYGYRRLHVLLRREGWPVNAKRVYRLYSEEGLTIRLKLPRRKRAWRYRVGRPGATAPNEIWAMGFVADQLFDGRPIRILAVLDAHTREALSIVPRATFRAFDLVQELGRLARERGRPKTLKVNNGPGFAGRMLGQWAHLNGWRSTSRVPANPRTTRISKRSTAGCGPNV